MMAIINKKHQFRPSVLAVSLVKKKQGSCTLKGTNNRSISQENPNIAKWKISIFVALGKYIFIMHYFIHGGYSYSSHVSVFCWNVDPMKLNIFRVPKKPAAVFLQMPSHQSTLDGFGASRPRSWFGLEELISWESSSGFWGSKGQKVWNVGCENQLRLVISCNYSLRWFKMILIVNYLIHGISKALTEQVHHACSAWVWATKPLT